MQPIDQTQSSIPCPPHTHSQAEAALARGEAVHQRRALLAGLGGLAAGAMFASRAAAGPLNPPAGPITSTGKTLTDIEPRTAVNATNTPGDANFQFIITQPGSYYLTGNITGESGKSGISIQSSHVTLDLNGFRMQGVAGAVRAIVASGTQNNLVVRNGIVHNWPSSGIDLATFSAGENALIELCLVSNCGQTGIRAASNAVINACCCESNGLTGILAQTNATITNCAARSNGAAGIAGNLGSVVRDCTARSNAGAGIVVSDGSAVISCASLGNTQSGIDAGSGSTIQQCASSSNGTTGIIASINSVIAGCTARNNGEVGINAFAGSMIRECVSATNGLHGILISGDTSVVGNTCRTNGTSGTGSGIRATSGDNRIEDNHCTDNLIGIDVPATGNFIARNRCSGNSSLNWSVVAGNACLVVAAASSTAISGNSGGTAPGSTDPNANFTF